MTLEEEVAVLKKLNEEQRVRLVNAELLKAHVAELETKLSKLTTRNTLDDLQLELLKRGNPRLHARVEEGSWVASLLGARTATGKGASLPDAIAAALQQYGDV